MLGMWRGMHGNFEAMKGVVGLEEEDRVEGVPKDRSWQGSDHSWAIITNTLFFPLSRTGRKSQVDFGGVSEGSGWQLSLPQDFEETGETWKGDLHTYLQVFHSFLDRGEVGRVRGILRLEEGLSFHYPGLQGV